MRLSRLVVQTRPLLGSEYAPGTVPYVQVYSGGRVLFTSKWCHLDKFDAEDGLVSFQIDLAVQGDVVRGFPVVVLLLYLLVLSLCCWLLVVVCLLLPPGIVVACSSLAFVCSGFCCFVV